MSAGDKIKILFLGASGTVTGSKYLIQTEECNVLVDCGMFQGLKKLRLLNWSDFPVNPSEVDHVLLTHGHLDHVGYLPRLVNQGFRGTVFGTAPTLEVAKIILEDSARIQEEDAERANREKFSKHHPAKPLYGIDEVRKVLPLFKAKPLAEWISLSPNIRFRFRYNGHILGAAFIELMIYGKSFVFSGDIGRSADPLLNPPDRPERADVLLIESTYGNRVHPQNPTGELAAAINRACDKKGTVIIPGFAVERIQLLMYLIWQLKKRKAIPDIPVYMDSPMGRSVLDIFHRFPEWHKLPLDECNEMCKSIKLIQTAEETEKTASDKSVKIVIAGSGMASGGRVLTYFQKYLGNPAATVLLVGHQAEGTRGRQLIEGAPEIKLRGNYYPVRAQVKNIEGLSAHADQKELLGWMGKIENKPERIFIVHGEPLSSDALRVKIKDVYGWNCEVPELNETSILQ